MDIKKLQTLVVDALEDVKAQEIVVFDTTGLTSLFDRIAVASGTSNRQTKALAASVRDKVKAAGGNVVGIEGEDTGEWVLVDLGDMIVHIMQPAIRQYYRLEEIWGEKPVKLGAAKRKGTAEAIDIEADKPKSKHLAALKDEPAAQPIKERKLTAAKKVAVKKPAAKRAAPVPQGKTVKVLPSKTETAAVEALKASPKKRAPVKKTADGAEAVAAAPVKRVIKRVKKDDAE